MQRSTSAARWRWTAAALLVLAETVGCFRSAKWSAAPRPATLPTDARIALIWDAASGRVVRNFGTTPMKDDADLEKHLADAKAAHDRSDPSEFTVTIDAAAAVPWADVVADVNRCKRLGITKLEFAFGSGK